MKVLIAGDIAPRLRMSEQIAKKYYHSIFSDSIVDLVKSADYSIANFECPMVGHNVDPIIKVGPNLKCPLGAEKAVKYAGFHGVTLANNHILDYGEEGLLMTVDAYQKVELDTVGVGKDLKSANTVLYVERDKHKIAIINCCEHEFSIATESSAGANPLNPVHQYYNIQKAKENADFVLVITHGGHEHFNLPSLRMQDTYRFFIDAGADVVVNHHQHCYSGYEMYKGKLIFYGLGNFAFDGNRANRNRSWNEGYLLMINFDLDKIMHDIYPYEQYGEKASVSLLDKHAFDAELIKLNSIISDRTKLVQAVEEYYSKSNNVIRLSIEPIRNRYIIAAQVKKLLPSFLQSKYLRGLYNMVTCESHRDILIHFLKNNYL